VKAFILIKVEPGKVKEALAFMSSMAKVVEVYAVTGPDDIICKVEVETAKDLSELVISELHQVEGLQATDTRIVVEI
jgi:DNA-binding Lrp family transcriptional regulator